MTNLTEIVRKSRLNRHSRFRFLRRKLKITELNIQLFMACLVGIGAGFASVFFKYVLHQLHYFFFGVLYSWLSTYSIFLLPIIPMIGAVLLIPYSLRYPGEINGYGMPRFLIAVHLRGGLIRTRAILIKIFTAAITISSGGSAGVEGPIVQIGGAIGSSIGRFFMMGTQRLRVLIACGSAAGIAAQFNAPLAGVLFAHEIVMVGGFQLQSFGVIVISSGLATAVNRAYYTSDPVFGFLRYNIDSNYEYGLYILLGLLIGVLAVVFIRMFFKIGDFFANLKINDQLKPIIGAFMVGVLGLVHFDVLGDGYKVLGEVLSSETSMTAGVILLLVFLKMLATSITLGSGNVGGVFGPSLFLGAMIGYVFGWVCQSLFPQLGISPGSYALVGMGAFLAAATHAPMTSIFLLFELTNNYQIIIPIMFASVLGVMVSRKLCPDSLDSMELSRQGINLHSGGESNILNSITVSSVMIKDIETVYEDMTFEEFMRIIPLSRSQYYPVLDRKDNLYGVVSFQDIREILQETGLEHLVIMRELAETELIKLFPHDNLSTAMQKFGIKDIEVIPVVDSSDQEKLLGIIKRKDVIDAYNKAVIMRDLENHQE
ncbi:MAG: chloride channel protein [Deltaproteobacteria bacterium]|nr:chloride channel protein [Deltaproteobacteria bacterium]